MGTENEQLSLIKNETEAAPVALNENQGISGIIAAKANEAALRNTIKVAVLRALASVGQALAKEDITFMVDGLKAEILRAYAGIRLEEIGLAIHKIAMGEFGKIYKLTLSVLVCGIRDYMHSESRLTAVKAYLQSTLQLQAPTRPSDNDIIKMKKRNVITAFDVFKRKGKYEDYGNAIFDNLVEFGLMQIFTDEQKIQIWKDARKFVYRKYASQLSSLQVDRRTEAIRIIEELKKYKYHNLFFYEAKNIALNMVFKEFETNKIELEDLLNIDDQTGQQPDNLNDFEILE